MDPLTRIVVPGGASESWLGSELVTPTNPAGLTAGTVSGNDLLLDDTNDAGGTPPNIGLAWLGGVHRVSFAWTAGGGNVADPTDFDLRVRNITDSTNAVSESIATRGAVSESSILIFTSVAGKSYQPQIVCTDGAGDRQVMIRSIKHEFLPALAQNEQAHTEPEDGIVHKRDSSGNLLGILSTEGEVPFYVPPGLTAIFIVPLDAPLPGYSEPQSVKGRTVTVTATGAPRYTG